MDKGSFFRSFRYASSGVAKTFLTGRNFKVMLGCLALVVVLGLLLRISAMEWCVLLICSGVVLALEILNTAIETTIDLIVSGHSKPAGDAKDMAAGAVLTASVFAAAVACIVFIPHICAILNP